MKEVATMKIGILHPGKMGATLARSLKASGHEHVFWASNGRSAETTQRASDCDLIDLGTVEAILDKCDVVFSIVHGGWCQELAEHIGRRGYNGIFVEANGLWGEESEKLLSYIFKEAGVHYVEAGLYGWPYPGLEGYSNEHTMYLSGELAGSVAALFTDAYWDVVISEKSAKALKRERHASEVDSRLETN